MKFQHGKLRGFAIILMVASLGSRAFAESGALVERFGVTTIPARRGIVHFEQITFDYRVGRIADSDWGQIRIDPKRLLSFARSCEGFVNVFVPDAAGRMSWIVDNVYVAGNDAPRCSGADEKGRVESLWDDPFPDGADGVRKRARPVPVVKYLDLRPGHEGQGRVRRISAVVWFSRSPVPNADEFLAIAQGAAPVEYPVRRVLDNAEGDLSAAPSNGLGGIEPVLTPRIFDARRDEDVPRRALPGPSKLAIGPPPQAVLTRPLRTLVHTRFPIGVFQSSTPNVDAARNQCVPAAHANALAYLEQRYNFNPNIWDLPHHHVRGLGQLTIEGEFPIYNPVPSWSVVANVDFFTMRNGTFDLDSGGGTGGCKNFLGLLKYLHFVRSNAAVMRVRHQGAGDQIIGENAGCDPGNLAIGGLKSYPEGAAPTFEWMRDQLQAGRSLVIGWGRYNDAGEWTGGHKVRVYGASQYNGRKYLYMLDDSNQGSNFVGLRTFSFEVTDLHTPGAPGVPNGFLEIDGMATRQIVTAISVEPKPRYIFE